MSLVENYQARIEKAQRDAASKSNLNESDFESGGHHTLWKGVNSMDSAYYMRLLNSLLGYEDVVHTHIGFFCGASLFTALEGNSPKRVFALDNFFNDPNIREQFLKNSSRLGFDGRYRLIEGDCFKADLSLIDERVNFHLYDAHHDEWAQYEGIKRFSPTFADVVIILVDNFSLPGVARGSNRAVEDLDDFDVKFKTIDPNHQGHGFYVLQRK